MVLKVVDCEATAKAWAKTEPNISGAVGGAIFFSTPQSYSPAPPAGVNAWIVVSMPAETHEPDDLALQLPLLQWDCWGRTKAQAASAALAVQQAGRQLSLGVPVVVGSAVIVSGEVSQVRWLPDPTTNTPRYIVDLLLAMRGAEGP